MAAFIYIAVLFAIVLALAYAHYRADQRAVRQSRARGGDHRHHTPVTNTRQTAHPGRHHTTPAAVRNPARTDARGRRVHARRNTGVHATPIRTVADTATTQPGRRPMNRVYLGGPMRGHDQFNFPAFDEAARHLRSYGYHVLSPAEHDRASGFDETLNSLDGFDIEAAMAWDLRAIEESDFVAFLPGWGQSSGCRTEYAHARKFGRPIYSYMGPDNGEVMLFLVPKTVLDDQETRVTEPSTGGQKGTKLARFDLVPPRPLWTLAEHYGRGAEKYEDRNWQQGTRWSLNFAALMRHAWQFWDGEDIDPETGSPHMAAVAWHAFALLEFANTHPELDDRPSTDNVDPLEEKR